MRAQPRCSIVAAAGRHGRGVEGEGLPSSMPNMEKDSPSPNTARKREGD